ncbi:hypothetical protein LEP1GSC172_4139 [Leptospira noguchii]|uniref:Uncharacterized protein n=2 Tax=Leptospira noguchii TaxID=28182 RepID=T0FCD7_9LEPT|nr:hypothetical protein LEP1GSC172_4139 [Leptospira noguchii]EQA70853.1 hypothetical protein LEP1GSC059_3483 [Leptospira noguchii serovar Panama str. CZ214]
MNQSQNNVSLVIIHFSEKSWNLNFADVSLKCGNYHDLKNRSL